MLAMDRAQARPRVGQLQSTGLWMLQILSAAAFVATGYFKLAGDPAIVELYHNIGVGQGFRYLTGSLEWLGALALLTAGCEGLGALLLAALMTGAVLLHLFVIGGSPAPALLLLALNGFIAFGRRDQFTEDF